MTWRLHWLEAFGDLGPWRTSIVEEVEIARKAITGVLPVSPFDIRVRRLPGAVIPKTGTISSPPEPWECAVTDEVLAANLTDNRALVGNGHDHRAWFFGFGGRYPRWLGYPSRTCGKDRERHGVGLLPTGWVAIR